MYILLTFLLVDTSKPKPLFRYLDAYRVDISPNKQVNYYKIVLDAIHDRGITRHGADEYIYESEFDGDLEVIDHGKVIVTARPIY